MMRFLRDRTRMSNISLSYAWARTQRAVIQSGSTGPVLIFTAATPDWAVGEIRRRFGELEMRQVNESELDNILADTYAQTGDAAAVVDAAANDINLDRLMQDIPEVEDLLENQDDAPVIRMINALFTQAVRDDVSDIHIEPFEACSVVRYRVDGSLREIVNPRRALHNALVSRIKVMASLDIAEKRLPQDGRISLRVGGRPIDVRVSTLPTGHGERVVLRLLHKEAGRLQLERLGMSTDVCQRLDQLIRQPHGIVLVTGPTGSGKTTTLYAALGRLDACATNIMTVEDPIEYDLPGIAQTQINPRIDLTFANALRAILRQDPDVVMIGEIRDFETAQIAVQASLTGHLVLATLHTNDSVSAVTRLIDMGVEPFLLASTLQGVLAQRLVRRLCSKCKVRRSGADDWIPTGCPDCNHTGYGGRTGIHELFVVTETLRSMIHANNSEQAIRHAAHQAGMRNLRQDGDRWVAQGISSIEEIARVTCNA